MITGAETEVLDVFEGKLQKLIGMCDTLKSENLALRQVVAQGKAREAELQQKIEQLSADYGNLKATKVLSVSGHDLESTRKKVSGLVCEIDRCIEMLNV
ncbi:MAG: hypothetical protein MJY65_06950 [Bacteroidaceae bacterium]|nr:hypothetical protein [Bacteroidaceae bacterium]